MDGVGTAITQVDTTARHKLWAKRVIGNKIYRYVYNTGANSIVAGAACFRDTATDGYVTTSGTLVPERKRPGGIGVSTIANGSYGWIQRGGKNSTIKKTTYAGEGYYLVGVSHVSGRVGGAAITLATSYMAFGFSTASYSVGSVCVGILTLET